MNNYGFIKVAAAVPNVKVADCEYNAAEIIRMMEDAENKAVSVLVFPELSLTAYTCQDLFLQKSLLDGAKSALSKICEATKNKSVIVIVGLPLEIGNSLYNASAVLYNGAILGVVPKTFLPNYNEFYEKRWFSSACELKHSVVYLYNSYVPVGTNLVFETSDFRFGIEICEDLWTVIPPSSMQTLFGGADIVFNLSASNETTGKHLYRRDLIKQQSARCISGYVYVSAGNGESTTDTVYSGSAMIAESGTILAESERFCFKSQLIISEIDVEKLRNERLRNTSFRTSEYPNVDYKAETVCIDTLQKKRPEKDIALTRHINKTPFVPSSESLDERCSEIFSIQMSGLAKRLLHTNIKSVVIGVSGGLDSTLALLVLVKAFDKLNIPRKNIYGITMPGFGTTGRTYNNAISLMEILGVTSKEISIKTSVLQHFKDIEHDEAIHDVTYENSQARERTQILMDYANKVNGLVIGTGDLSELALGWCTYNGDHMSMYALNIGIPKTLVRTLVTWVANTQMEASAIHILTDIVNTPISPELLPASENGEISQITEDSVGPYRLHDFVLYNMLRYGFEPQKIYYLAKIAFKDEFTDEVILKWLKVFYRRFFTQQFKRSCMPDGPKIGSINLSPRSDWRMPSDASYNVWIKQLESLV